MAPKNKEKGGKKKAAEEPPPEISTVDRPNVLDTLFPEWNEAAIAGDKVDAKGRRRSLPYFSQGVAGASLVVHV
jgi:hypothetical protein